MAEDTGWLKKNPVGNPFRMSLRRSSRFYAQDMDGSIMTEEGKTKNQVLVVSHMPRRSNIPIEKIKQMDFRIPAPVSKKSGIKKPVTRMTKFPLGQPFSRPSIYFRNSPGKNAIENQKSKNTNVRSNVSKQGQPSGCLLPTPKPGKDGGDSVAPESCRKISMQGSADLSILSRSKIVNQSTPNDAAILRTILKHNVGIARRSPGKKSKAVKRVNFSCVAKMGSDKKENEEPLPEAEESYLTVDLNPVMKRELLCDDEDSTVAFSSSFKPITYEEIGSDKDEEIVKVPAKVCQESTKTDSKNKTAEISESGSVMGNIIQMWSAYRSRLNEIWTQLQLNDECFLNNLKFLFENGLQDKFSVYEIEKCRLYEELKCLEQDFRDEMMNKIDVRTSFLRYLEKKVNIYGEKSELEEEFEKTLYTIAGMHVVRGEKMNEGKDDEEGVSKEFVDRRNLSLGKGKSECLNNSKVKTASLKRAARHMVSSGGGGSTPESTPARRKKLSRRIEDQIRSLFEE